MQKELSMAFDHYTRNYGSICGDDPNFDRSSKAQRGVIDVTTLNKKYSKWMIRILFGFYKYIHVYSFVFVKNTCLVLFLLKTKYNY